MDSSLYLLILFVLHICCGIFWAGTALLLNFYILPAIKRAGPDGGKFMHAFLSTKKFPVVLTVLMSVTVAAGLLLMHYLSNGFEARWFGTKQGIVLSTGGLMGVIAFMFAFFINFPCVSRIKIIGDEMMRTQTPASEAQMAELTQLRNRVVKSTHFIAWLILITIVCMAAAEHI